MSETTPRPYGTLLFFLFFCLLLAAIYYWMLPGKTLPDELQGVLRPEPTPLQAFELIDQNRQPFRPGTPEREVESCFFRLYILP